MEIDINQREISIGDKYDIFLNERPARIASSKLFRLLRVLELFTRSERDKLLTIYQRFSPWKSKYDIVLPGNQILEFRTVSWWRNHYSCVVGSSTYEVFAHRGRKCSVYKDQTQVAWWEKKAVSWFKGDNYKIIADDDCDVNLIIALCLIMEEGSTTENDSNTITYDFGRIGAQAREFNPMWFPKVVHPKV